MQGGGVGLMRMFFAIHAQHRDAVWGMHVWGAGG